MFQIMVQDFQKAHNLRLIIDQCKHDHTKCILKLCMLVKLVQNDIRVHISSQFDADTHTFTA